MSVEAPAEHLASNDLYITDPPLERDHEDRKDRHHRNRDPGPGANGERHSCHEQTGQHNITLSASTQCSESPSGHGDYICACSRSDGTERLPDNLTDHRTCILQFQLRGSSQITGCLPVCLAERVTMIIGQMTGLVRRPADPIGRLTGGSERPNDGITRSVEQVL
jgi:hypothetical protein